MPNIRYRSLRFQNGYAYRECEIPLDQQGLVLVRGLNVDDGGFLGAGKTSPFEIFSLLQTGRVGKQRPGERILADDVVNLNVGEGFEARLRFDVDDKPFEIIQHRKHPKFGNGYRIVDVDAGRDILPGSNRKHPQKWVAREVLSIDEQSFFNLVYLAQDFSNIMLYGTEGDRQKSLIQMFGLDVYDDLYKRTKAKLSALRQTTQDIDTLQAELDEIETELTAAAQTPEVLEAALNAKRAELLELQQTHDTTLNSMEELETLLRKVEQRGQLIKDVKKLWGKVELEVEQPKDVTRDLVAALEEEATAATAREAKLRSSIQLLDQRDILEQRLANLGSCDPEETEAELEQVRTDLRRLTNVELPRAEERLEVTDDLQTLQRPSRPAADIEEELETAKEERRATQQDIDQIQQVLNSEICPTCGQSLKGSAHDPAKLKVQLRLGRSKLKKTSQTVHDLTSELSNAREYEELRERLKKIGASSSPSDVQKEIGRLTREERRLTGLLEAENLRQTLQQQLAALPKESAQQLKRKLARLVKRRDQLRQQHTTAAAILEKLETIRGLPKGKVASLRKRLREAHQTVRDAANDLVTVGEAVARLERLHERLQGLVRRQQKIERGLQKTKQVRTDIRCYQALEAAFGSKGLKRDRFHAILQDATEQTVPYYTQLLWPRHNAEISLADLGSGVKFDLRRGDFVTSSRLLSGGERNKAGLSLLFGMRDLKEKYTGLRTNVLIVDEPFGNLDAYGTDNLIRVLQDQRDRFGTVLVIGNQRDVLDHPNWDQVWWVVREQHEAKLYRKGLPARYHELAERYRRLEA